MIKIIKTKNGNICEFYGSIYFCMGFEFLSVSDWDLNVCFMYSYVCYIDYVSFSDSRLWKV